MEVWSGDNFEFCIENCVFSSSKLQNFAREKLGILEFRVERIVLFPHLTSFPWWKSHLHRLFNGCATDGRPRGNLMGGCLEKEGR